MSNNEGQVISLTYQKAGLMKRMVAFLIDAILIGTLALGMFWALRLLVENTSWYHGAFDTYVSVSVDSKLFVYAETEDNLVQIDTYAKGTFKDDAQKVSFLEQRLHYFYVDDPLSLFDGDEGEKLYRADKIGKDGIKKSDGSYYFALNQDGDPASIVPDAELIAFYEQATISAIEYLNRSEDFVNAKRVLSQTINFLLIPLSIAVSFTLFELLIPLLFFRRGWQTLGLAVFHYALLNSEAVVPMTRFFIFRFLFMLFIEVLLSMMTFGLPLFVTMGMMVIRKDGQALHDYLFGIYMVEAGDQSIYKSKEEYFALQAQAEGTSARPFLTSWYRDGDMIPPRVIEPPEQQEEREGESKK